MASEQSRFSKIASALPWFEWPINAHICPAVVTNCGDITTQFMVEEKNVLRLCQQQQINYAVLAESSPSCGSSKIYDGTFSGIKINGSGVTAALLERQGIKVFSQHTIAELRSVLETHS